MLDREKGPTSDWAEHRVSEVSCKAVQRHWFHKSKDETQNTSPTPRSAKTQRRLIKTTVTTHQKQWRLKPWTSTKRESSCPSSTGENIALDWRKVCSICWNQPTSMLYLLGQPWSLFHQGSRTRITTLWDRASGNNPCPGLPDRSANCYINTPWSREFKIKSCKYICGPAGLEHGLERENFELFERILNYWNNLKKKTWCWTKTAANRYKAEQYKTWTGKSVHTAIHSACWTLQKVAKKPPKNKK